MSEERIIERFRRAGIEPRRTDVRAVALMTAGEDDEGALRMQARYIWDHLFGEPEEPTLAAVEAALRCGSASPI